MDYSISPSLILDDKLASSFFIVLLVVVIALVIFIIHFFIKDRIKKREVKRVSIFLFGLFLFLLNMYLMQLRSGDKDIISNVEGDLIKDKIVEIKEIENKDLDNWFYKYNLNTEKNIKDKYKGFKISTNEVRKGMKSEHVNGLVKGDYIYYKVNTKDKIIIIFKVRGKNNFG